MSHRDGRLHEHVSDVVVGRADEPPPDAGHHLKLLTRRPDLGGESAVWVGTSAEKQRERERERGGSAAKPILVWWVNEMEGVDKVEEAEQQGS